MYWPLGHRSRAIVTGSLGRSRYRPLIYRTEGTHASIVDMGPEVLLSDPTLVIIVSVEDAAGLIAEIQPAAVLVGSVVGVHTEVLIETSSYAELEAEYVV